MAQDHDLRPHVETWHNFVRLLGFAVAGIALLLILMAILFL